MKKNKNIIKLSNDPFLLFKKWLHQAKLKEICNANAMNLATISKNFSPSSRVVLLKSFDKKGFVFYTNLKSKKGKSILCNSKVALNFYWKSIGKQIRIEGFAKIISNQESDKYFQSRSRESKIGAWSSIQSGKLSSRNELENKVKILTKKYKNKIIPRPLYWLGFRVKPVLLEFWKEMPFRLHDRVEYKKKGKKWIINRLYP